MKNILCKLGIHKRKLAYCTVTLKDKKDGKFCRKKYYFCKRCGKMFKKVEREG